ncbi:hypothetical protein AB0451_03545 [Streptomyces sp. NPDC052000]|uniref:hypothetical protein n=1 Tax=Streptomyces sp. NPDC052000 TaxID=3155676 RepID=UPI00344F8859
MTGPEHFREAERLLAESQTIVRPHDEGPCEADRRIAEAQVHATLALAAATALPPGTAGTGSRGNWVNAVHGLSPEAGERDDD